MASLPPFIRRRFLSTTTTTTTTTTPTTTTTTTPTNVLKKWAVKEVTKSNFSESLESSRTTCPAPTSWPSRCRKRGHIVRRGATLSPSTPPTLRISRPSTPLSASSSSSSQPALTLSEPRSLLLTHTTLSCSQGMN
ncbi:hypothetical protein ACFX14_035302 [Malus domestica]